MKHKDEREIGNTQIPQMLSLKHTRKAPAHVSHKHK